MGCCASSNGDGGSGGVVAVDRARTETTELNKLQPANSTVGAAAASNSGSVPQPAHDAKAEAGPHSPTNGMVDTSDRYKKKAVLGVGASCKVLSVVEKATGKLFAMKVLDKREAFNKHLWEAECKILHTLKHPNILELVESSEDSKAWYIITVMCTGGELFDRVSHGKFSERIAAMLTKEMLEAVQYCHKHHIVHRDLKPENFVFEGAAIESKMKLIDFGCALVVDDKELVKDVAGSPYYVAPEVLNPNFVRTGSVWKAADMWSVGVILYLFVCGRPPFFGDTQEQIFQAIRDGVYAYPRNIPLSSAVKDLIDSLLRKDPHKRLTATQCLEHEWIAGDAAPDKVLPESVVHSLGAFRHQQRLKKAVARVLAHRMTEADTEHLEIVFKKFDINGDGQLGRNEIEEMMKHIGKSAAEAKDLMAAIDDNGDGVISKEEFATALEVNRLGHNKAEIKASFDLFDVDHDGFVTAKEIERLCDFMRPEQVKQLIADVDTNNDGQINFAEWLAAMKDIGQKKPHRRTNIPGVAPEPGTQSASGVAAAAAVGQPQTMQQAMALAAEKAAAKSAAAEAMVAAADGKAALPGTAPSPTPSPAKI